MNTTNPVPTESSAVCPHCSTAITVQDNYCRRCGRSLKPGYSFWFSHTSILSFALLLGPFVLPWVWLSKRMGLVAKIIYSVLSLLIGYLIILTCYRLAQFAQETVHLLLDEF